MASTPFELTLKAIDAAHSLDPNKTTIDGTEVPYELHYAERMTHHLKILQPSASEPLLLACRAQHFRRWEVPRDTYPKTKPGYFKWRTDLKHRQADLVRQICLDSGYSEEHAEETASLVRKEGLGRGGKEGEVEVQTLEDCACLVFLEGQLEGFETEHEEEKVLDILRKTWKKMSLRGREAALELGMGPRAKELVGKALGPEQEADGK